MAAGLSGKAVGFPVVDDEGGVAGGDVGGWKEAEHGQ